MPACATQEIVADQPTIGNLFLPIPDTDFRAFLAEVDDMARFAPEIITAVEADLDLHARGKKSLRLADRRFFESQTHGCKRYDHEKRRMVVQDGGKRDSSGLAIFACIPVHTRGLRRAQWRAQGLVTATTSS